MNNTLGRFRLREPEYTGENRCIPCTIINVVLAIVLSIGVGLMLGWFISWGIGIPLAIVAFSISAASIYFRGYLVPGTPYFTKTYLPDSILRRFNKGPAAPSGTEEQMIDVETWLMRAEAVEQCKDGNDLCLTEDFERDWSNRITSLKSKELSSGNVAELLEVDPNRLIINEYGNAFVARVDSSRIGQWESRAAFLADLAAGPELKDRIEDWTTLDIQQRNQLLYGLRVFLKKCPVCDGPVAMNEETRESCCRSIDVVVVACEGCGERLFEMERPE